MKDEEKADTVRRVFTAAFRLAPSCFFFVLAFMVPFYPPISRLISRSTASGSGARVTGRPITR